MVKLEYNPVNSVLPHTNQVIQHNRAMSESTTISAWPLTKNGTAKHLELSSPRPLIQIVKRRFKEDERDDFVRKYLN